METRDKSFHTATLLSHQNPSSGAGTFITYQFSPPPHLVKNFLGVKVPENEQRADVLISSNSSFSIIFFISKINLPCCRHAITSLVFTYWCSVQMGCAPTCKEVRTLSSGANADTQGGLSATVCILLRIKKYIKNGLLESLERQRSTKREPEMVRAWPAGRSLSPCGSRGESD